MRVKRILFFVALLLGVTMIVIGIVLTQPSSVLAKAVRICMECIGIG